MTTVQQRLTLADIAEQAGVSTATVSRVLNGKSNVAEVTRRQVLVALDLLGYERRLDDDALLCVFNFSGKKARLPLPRGWADGLIDEGSGLTGAEIRRGALVLGPWSGAVLTRP